jgi:hypothetical protein
VAKAVQIAFLQQNLIGVNPCAGELDGFAPVFSTFHEKGGVLSGPIAQSL